MSTGSKENAVRRILTKRPLVYAFSIILILVCISCIVMLAVVNKEWNKIHESYVLTRPTSEKLTNDHGQEVGTAIESWETIWRSYEAYMNPALQARVATGPFLDLGGLATEPDLYEQSGWLVTTNAVLKDVLVYEFNEDRFKASACVERSVDKVNPEGIFIEALPAFTACGIYAFNRENDHWKLTDYFNTNLPYSAIKRDWYLYRPEWSIEILGEELPEPLLIPTRQGN